MAQEPGLLAAMERFYVDELGLSRSGSDHDGLTLRAGPATVGFLNHPRARRPFFHFALLVPGNRFDAARRWLGAQASLLSRPDDDRTTFRFDSWHALACYGHDPSGNILELIAHDGIGESGATGAFDAGELRGISEVGLVADDVLDGVTALRRAGLELWDGELDSAGGGLGFVGRQAHTLILCRPGRPWLPTARPAESHPVTITLAGADGSVVETGVRDGHVFAG
jgi:hypothetical protein